MNGTFSVSTNLQADFGKTHNTMYVWDAQAINNHVNIVVEEIKYLICPIISPIFSFHDDVYDYWYIENRNDEMKFMVELLFSFNKETLTENITPDH